MLIKMHKDYVEKRERYKEKLEVTYN